MVRPILRTVGVFKSVVYSASLYRPLSRTTTQLLPTAFTSRCFSNTAPHIGVLPTWKIKMNKEAADTKDPEEEEEVDPLFAMYRSARDEMWAEKNRARDQAKNRQERVPPEGRDHERKKQAKYLEAKRLAREMRTRGAKFWPL